MKHELTLPQRPSVLFLIVLFDLFALVAVYGLYGTNWVSTTGIAIELPRTPLQNELVTRGEALAVKITGKQGKSMEIGQQVFGREEGLAFLQLRQEAGLRTVFLMIDRTLPIAVEREAISALQQVGLRLILISESQL